MLPWSIVQVSDSLLFVLLTKVQQPGPDSDSRHPIYPNPRTDTASPPNPAAPNAGKSWSNKRRFTTRE